jgi:hypothetical protein
VLPPLFSRMLLSMTVTIAGHLLDALLVLAALAFLLKPEDPKPRVAVALLSVASLLTYVTSLFTVTALLVALAAVERRHARFLLAVAIGGTMLTVLWLYRPFLFTFLGEIVPSLFRAPSTPGAGNPGISGGLGVALGRIPFFYGPAYPLLAIGGLLLLRPRLEPPAWRLLVAYAIAFVVLVGLRAFGGGLFRDLKEMEFVAPLVAVLSGAVIDQLAQRERAGRIAAVLVVIALVVYGLGRYRDFLESYASPFLAVQEGARSASLEPRR